MDIDELELYINKAREILYGNPKPSLIVPPWDPRKVKRASEIYGNNDKIQRIIAGYYKIDK
ncbi:hypothetical protein ACFFJY_00355 [Fictibacillus aquaticus]|uniref:Uncharacterized protein n=1 Tax=Fictibacillus aquaticus TaxID=2021314 RepID=A0A235F769_9BACL|nr:hypothetical protein [Fictibacillus aquaticus]OYD57181.1 hypothetical protein CGZ90_10835 [Fictibacillus aquaticus]